MGSLNTEDHHQAVVVLLFGVKLVRVKITGICAFKDLVARIQSSDEFDLPSELRVLMKKYKPRNYRYFTPRQIHPIQDIDRVPEPQELNDLVSLCAERGTTRCLRRSANLLNGSFLNLVVEEPLPIDQLPKDGDARFRSREVVIFLNQHGIDLFTIGHAAPVCSGSMGETSHQVWCKLVRKRELSIFEALEHLNPGAHHIATLLIEPYLFPTNQYLITMCDYGDNLFFTTAYSSWARERLCGMAIHSIAIQLCEAIAFLHSHGFFHLDIKPHNLAFDHATSHLTVLDLGWVMHGDFINPVITGATGTREYAPPEVAVWFEWEATDEDDSTPSPPSFDPRKADVWAIGNVISILLYSDVEQVDYGAELVEFSRWLLQHEPKDRPTIEEALKRLQEIATPPWGHGRS
ncbi:hypothetical protein AAF712_003978 [Marasmius tenuissimus]|uniref:Protein kinase domain-containing protein n=1 Tax=Marasmius tenuissimus TaxID=585030 RepID=A0ABR3A4V0_9AGAR